jgi:hypothetical protein
MSAYLESSFLERVRRAYRLAMSAKSDATGGPIWSPINTRRADVHAALVDERDDALREIFANPTKTDLYYGCDHLCRSLSGPISPKNFLESALSSGRARYAANQVKRLSVLLGEIGTHSVIEIGPGMGRVAFFAYSEGITNYATIDLPLGVVAQACFLARALGPDKIWFAGEAPDTASNRVKLFSDKQKPSGRYGVALNVDSMTEMPRWEAFTYARWIDQHASLFLSVNHPQHVFSVGELMAFAGLKRLHRSTAFDPEGYAAGIGYREEVFRATDAANSLAKLRWQAFRSFTGARERLRNYSKIFGIAAARQANEPTQNGGPSKELSHW